MSLEPAPLRLPMVPFAVQMVGSFGQRSLYNKRIYVDFDRGRTRWITLPSPQTARCFWPALP